MVYLALFIIIVKSLKNQLIKLPFKFIKVFYLFIERNEKKVMNRLKLSLIFLGIKKDNNSKL